jgi:hypothetical protein
MNERIKMKKVRPLGQSVKISSTELQGNFLPTIGNSKLPKHIMFGGLSPVASP